MWCETLAVLQGTARAVLSRPAPCWLQHCSIRTGVQQDPPCVLCVLSNRARQFAALDPMQYHRPAYIMCGHL